MKRSRAIALATCLAVLFNASGLAASFMHPGTPSANSMAHCAQSGNAATDVPQVQVPDEGRCCVKDHCPCMMAGTVAVTTRFASIRSAKVAPADVEVVLHRPVPPDDSLRPPIH